MTLALTLAERYMRGWVIMGSFFFFIYHLGGVAVSDVPPVVLVVKQMISKTHTPNTFPPNEWGKLKQIATILTMARKFIVQSML